MKGQFVYAALIDIASEQHNQSEQYVATIKLDDSSADKRARFKDISIKKRPLYVGQTQEINLANVDSPADRAISVQQLVDFVKSDFADSPLFSEKIPQKNELRFSVDPELVVPVGSVVEQNTASDFRRHIEEVIDGGIESDMLDAGSSNIWSKQKNSFKTLFTGPPIGPME